MIYVLSLNPSIDYHMEVDTLLLGETNRSQKEILQIGGKGINVATLLNNLNTHSTLLGFVGGEMGSFITHRLDKLEYIDNALIQTKHNTRINVKIKGQKETEINGSGEAISHKESDALYNQLADIDKGEIVVMSGSLAKGMDSNWHVELAKMLHEKEVEFVVDIATKNLLDICAYQPLLIKPNLHELETIFETKIESIEACIPYGQKLIALGAKNCIISLGDQGSYLITQDHVFKAGIPEGELVNSVGAGDSMVAGFVDAYVKNKDIKEVYKLSVAASSATAYSEHIADKETIESLIDKVKIGEVYETK